MFLMKAIVEAMAIVLVALLLSMGNYQLRPDAFVLDASEYELKLESALALPEAIWIDARIDEAYAKGSFDEALSLNEEDWESGFAGLMDKWYPEVPIVVFCSSQSCLRSHHVARRLREELGVENAYALKGGWESLRAADLVKGDEL